jgi:hypothetical protein
MKKIYSLVSILFFVANVFAQNVGINNTNPAVSLDVQGGLATRAVTVTPFANNVNLPNNASFVIVAPGTGVVTAYTPTFIDGQRMTVFNSGGFNVIVQISPSNVIVPPNEARDFICRAPGG